MPPEQWQNRKSVSSATDIYNLGCTLFFALTGSYPFSGEQSLEIRRQHLEDDPLDLELAQRIPEPLKAIVAKAMAKRPLERFRTMAEMEQALAAIDLTSIRTKTELDTSDESIGDTSTSKQSDWRKRISAWFKSSVGKKP